MSIDLTRINFASKESLKLLSCNMGLGKMIVSFEGIHYILLKEDNFYRSQKSRWYIHRAYNPAYPEIDIHQNVEEKIWIKDIILRRIQKTKSVSKKEEIKTEESKKEQKSTGLLSSGEMFEKLRVTIEEQFEKNIAASYLIFMMQFTMQAPSKLGLLKNFLFAMSSGIELSLKSLGHSKNDIDTILGNLQPVMVELAEDFTGRLESSKESVKDWRTKATLPDSDKSQE